MTRKASILIIAIIIVLSIFAQIAMASDETLKRGSKGSLVKELQEILMEQGVFEYEKATGYFGKITEDAVKAFQKKYDLKADGIVGENTWKKLRAEMVIKIDNEITDDITDADEGTDESTNETVDETAEATSIELSGTISKGMEGDEVEAIQKRLQQLGLYEYSRITGYYGSVTQEAVKDFQKAYSLMQDGVVGNQTMQKLFSTYKETSLIPGMKNDDVGELQERLKELGYYSYSIDNEYGSKTREAVVYFQTAHKLKADGIAGTQTKQILYSSAAMTEQEARRTSSSSNDQETSNEPEPDEMSEEGKTTAQQVIEMAKSKLGCKYVYATEGPNTFDCTGFTSYIYSKFNISLPRTAYNQGYSQYGVKITDPSKLEPGDLVFFNTNKTDGDLSDHAGIYIGNGDFIHANSGSVMCVVITNMNTSNFYKEAFSWGRRVLN